MGWGRLDDGFDDHPKVVAILDEDDTGTAAAAIGLWTLCWSWAHRNTRKRGGSPGVLPAGLPRRFLGHIGKDAAQLLVKHRLWEPRDDGGWLIHDFDQYLPTEDTRAARSEAGKKGAEKRWAEKHAAEAAAAEAEMANSHGKDGNLPSSSQASASKPEANDGSRTRARRDPTPTPTPNPKEQVQELFPPPAGSEPTKSERIAADLARFEEFYSIFPRKKEPGDAERAWKKAIKDGATADEIIAGAKQYRIERYGKEARWTSYPASWLNAKGWLSEPDAPAPPERAGGRDGRDVSTPEELNEWAELAARREAS